MAAAGPLVVSASAAGQAPDASRITLPLRQLEFTAEAAPPARRGATGRQVAQDTRSTGNSRSSGHLDRRGCRRLCRSAFRDIERFERGPGILHIEEDQRSARAVGFRRDDARERTTSKALPKCKIGDCLVKVDAEALAALPDRGGLVGQRRATRRRTRWRGGCCSRRLLAYQQGGNRASACCATTSARPSSATSSWACSRTRRTCRSTPAGAQPLPAGLPDGEASRRRGVLLLVEGQLRPARHGAAQPRRDRTGIRASPAEVAIASKMLYATHYFHTALDLRYSRARHGASRTRRGST